MPELVWNRFFAACGAFFFATERPKSMMNRLTCRLVARADPRPLSKETRVVSRAPPERLFPSPLAGRAALATARPPGPR